MKKILFTMILLASGFAWSQEIIMATSEDLKEFDRLVGKAKAADTNKNGATTKKPHQDSTTPSIKVPKSDEPNDAKLDHSSRENSGPRSQPSPPHHNSPPSAPSPRETGGH